MNKTLTASTTLNFSEESADSGGGLRLVQDNDRKTQATTRITPKGMTVSCTTSAYVRLYPPVTPTTKVAAVTGSISKVGDAIAKDENALFTFGPDQAVQELDRGVSNIRIEQVGGAYDAAGNPTTVTVKYDPTRNALVATPACFCVCRIVYDEAYTLFLYNFSGSCPDEPPPAVDASGNALEIEPVKPFTEGLISAIDITYNAYTTMTMEPPTCTYQAISVNYLDTDRFKQVPTLKLEIDPEYPPRLVAGGGTNIQAECTIRCYPAGGASSFTSTSGISRKKSDGTGSRECTEVKTFQNSATASTDYPPAGMVQSDVIGTLVTLAGGGSSIKVMGPGETIEDVTYIENGNGRYENPRPRVLGSSEIAICDIFDHPTPAYGAVLLNYSSTFDRFVYTFALEVTGAKQNFASGFFIAQDSLGRASALQVNPPIMKNKSRAG